MREESFEWNGRSVVWRAIGSGPPIVLAHGTPWSSAVWMRLAKSLAQEHAVYSWDMPGFGMSSKHPEHPVDLATQSALFSDLIAHWQIETPRVIAHDIGGAVVLRSHLLDGVDFDRLTLVDAVVIQPWGSPFYALVQEHEQVFAQIPEAMHGAMLSAYIAGASRQPRTPEQRHILESPWLGPEGRPAFYRQIAQTRREHTDEIESRLGQVRCPRRVLWGAYDEWLPLSSGHDLAGRLGVDLEVIEDAGHLVQWDAPDALEAALRHD